MSQKRSNSLCQNFCLGESCPPALTLMLDNSVPPHMSLMSFNLLLQHWSSEGVSPSKSVHRPCKRNCLGFQQSVFHSLNPCWFLQLEVMETSSWHWNPGLGDLVWGWDPSLLRYPSQFLSATHGCGTSPFRVYAPPTNLDVVSSLTL